MISLKDFGAKLAEERDARGYSLANLSKYMGGISKQDIREWEAGEAAPGRVEIKQLMNCFPKLRGFEQDLRAGNFEAPEKKSEVQLKAAKPVEVPRQQPTRLAPASLSPSQPALPKLILPHAVPRHTPATPPPRRPTVEIVNPVAPAALSFQPFTPQTLRKTRKEMLGDLTQIVKKKLGNHTAEDHDFTIKNDGIHLIIRLLIEEKNEEDLVDSGCYVAAGPRGTDRLEIFCKTMTSGDYAGIAPRLEGVAKLLDIAKILHEAVKDRKFE